MNFPPSLLQFSFFSVHFFFFLASLFPVGQQNFTGEKRQWGTDLMNLMFK